MLHERWRDGDRYDIAILRLREPVSGVEPLPLYRGDREDGALVTLVGRGTSGTAIEGEEGGIEDARLRRATNRVTHASRFLLEIEMDAAGDPDVTALEGVGAAGDSGSPVFMDVDGIPHVVGLNAFGETRGDAGIGQYGALDYQTRVSAYIGWIESVAGPLPSASPSASAPTGCASTGTPWSPAMALAALLARRRRDSGSPHRGGRSS